MAEYFRKSERGRREVHGRSLQLSRPARNLLLILDGSRSLVEWTAMVQGASLADGVALLEAGLIEAMAGPAGPETRPAAFEPTEPMGVDAWLANPTVHGGLDRVSRPAPLDPVASAPVPLHDAPAGDLMNTRWPPLPGGSAASLPVLRTTVSGPGLAPGAAPSAMATPSTASTAATPTAPGGASGFAPLEPTALGRSALGYTELYDSLNALLRETLGLFRGYRYTLRIERAQNVQELEAVAREFLAEVRRLRGDTMARMVQRALGFDG